MECLDLAAVHDMIVSNSYHQWYRSFLNLTNACFPKTDVFLLITSPWLLDDANYKQPTLGLLLWGLTEGNPGFCSLISFSYGLTRFHNKFFVIENISFLYYRRGRADGIKFPHSSKPRRWLL